MNNRNQLKKIQDCLFDIQDLAIPLRGDMTEREEDIWKAHVTKPIAKVIEATNRMLNPKT